MYFVHVVDPPSGGLTRALQFRLGPFAQRDQAEAIAARARATNEGTETRIVLTDINTHGNDHVS